MEHKEVKYWGQFVKVKFSFISRMECLSWCRAIRPTLGECHGGGGRGGGGHGDGWEGVKMKIFVKSLNSICAGYSQWSCGRRQEGDQAAD